MAMPALKLELEMPVEERIARLEANVEHIQTDVAEIKIDIRRLDAEIEAVAKDLTTKYDSLKELMAAMAVTLEKMNSSRAFDRVWWLLTLGGVLATMARTFYLKP